MARKTNTAPPAPAASVTPPVAKTTGSQPPEFSGSESARLGVKNTLPTTKVQPVAAPTPTTVISESGKIKKSKIVRDSFTMPKDEYLMIDSLKLRAIKLGTSVKKGELLRAGIKVIAAMSDAAFKTALGNVPALKSGRPTDSK
jgi:hypothetical protein